MSQILIVHGAWGGAWEFDDVVSGLRGRGHHAQAVDLPGHGESSLAISEVSMQAYVDRVVEALHEFEGKVVLVGHSLAGQIISLVAEVAPQKIERLVYVAALLPQDGDSPLGLMQSDEGGELLARIEYSSDQSYATLSEATIREVMLHDVQDAELVKQYLPHFLMKQATEPFMAKAVLTDKGFASVPKSYLRCTQDKILTPALQDRMIATTKVEQVITLESGHFPLMSMPKLLVDAIEQMANSKIAEV